MSLHRSDTLMLNLGKLHVKYLVFYDGESKDKLKKRGLRDKVNCMNVKVFMFLRLTVHILENGDFYSVK